MVIIDTPPMLQMADARILGKLADAVVLVVRSAADHPGRSGDRGPAAHGRRNARAGIDPERMGPQENELFRLWVRVSALSAGREQGLSSPPLFPGT